MDNKKISTGVGAVVLVIIAITVSVFVWKWEKREGLQMTMLPEKNNELSKISNITPEVEEFPSIVITPGISLEEIIKQAVFKKYPDWEINNYAISVTIETNKDGFAIGRFVYDNNKQDKYHNSAEEIWFAAKTNDAWTLVATSAVGYWGACQDFEKFNFPKNLTPDCWDMEKNSLIETSNPGRFYENGFTKEDKVNLIKAYLSYQKNKSDHLDFYLNKTLYIKINKNTKNYTEGTVLFGGIENHSNPYFLAVKLNTDWKIILVSQDIPLCSVIDPYKFPKQIVDKCYDEKNKKERENIY